MFVQYISLRQYNIEIHLGSYSLFGIQIVSFHRNCLFQNYLNNYLFKQTSRMNLSAEEDGLANKHELVLKEAFRNLLNQGRERDV